MKKTLRMKFMLLLFALIVGFSSAWADSYTFNLNELYQNGVKVTDKTVLANNSNTNGQSLVFYNSDGKFKITITKNNSNTSPGYYTSSGYIRFYNSDVLTIESVNNDVIKGLSISTQSSGFNATVSPGSLNNQNWSGSASSISFTGTGTNKWNTITITYAHTLTYSATNGSISGKDSQNNNVVSGATFNNGETVTLTAHPNDGYEFSSWSDGGNNSTLSSTSTNPTSFTMGTANVTVTATFVESGGATTYSVTYNENGATSGSVPTDGNSYEANDLVTVLGNTGNLAKTGNAFSGWCMNAGGTGTVYGPNNTNTFNITSNTTLYAKWTPYTITAASNNNDYGTVQLNGTVITATPAVGYTYASTAYTVSPGSATVVQNGNEFTVTPSSDCTVTINFVAIPTHTATFSVNGNTSTNTFYEGQTISFPSDPAAISGKSFVGWATATISGTTNTAPTLVISATMGNSDVTYYAVFADVTGTTDPTWTETAIGSISSTDVIIISDGTYAMNNDGGASYAPTVNSISVSGTSLSAAPANNLKWNVSGNATDGYTFYPNGTTSTWLYCNTTASSGSNSNIRVGTGNRKVWKFDNSGYLVTKDTYTARYLSIYVENSTPKDFRGYTGTGNGAFVPKFYKYTAGSTTYGNYCTTVVVTYTVTYDGNGATSGDVPADATAYSPNASVTVLGNTGNLAKTGYAFGGWNTQNDGQGTNYAANATFNITANTTLYAKWTAKTCTNLTAQGTPDKTTYSAGENFDPTGLTVTATYNDASQEVVTTLVTWTPDPLTQGTTSVTGTYMGQTVNVNGLTVNATPGSADNPYTVAQAIANTPSSGTSSNVYIHGIVSAFFSTNDDILDDTYHRYYISDDGTTEGQLLVFNGKLKENTAFSNVDDLRVGDIVTIFGGLTTYNNTKEVAADNYIVSHQLVAPTFSVAAGEVTSGTTVAISDLHTTNTTIYYTTDGTNPTNESSVYSTPISITTATTIKAIAVKSGYTTSDVATAEYTILVQPTITVTAENPVNVSAAGGSGELALSYANFTVSKADDLAVQFYDVNDEEINPTWIAAEVVDAEPSGYKVSYIVFANEGVARTAYFKVWALDGSNPVYSNKVTVTQAAADYATLPFEYTDDNVNNDLSLNNMPNGLTQVGLGTYSSSTPRLKFDTKGDYLVLKLNAAPVQISYDIKCNGSFDGTFKVQLSSDGEDYEDLAVYTTLGGTTSNITHICKNNGVRYIKWIYTNRTSGNVALGNINVNANSPTINNLAINTGETLVVSNGAILTLTGSVTNNGALVIEDGGQLITKISGITATVKKNIEGATHWGAQSENPEEQYTPNGWYFIASPVDGADFPTGSVASQDIYQLDWANEKWLNLQSSGHSSLLDAGFTRGMGYLYASKDGNTISVAGEIQPLSDSDNATITLTTTGWHLIGNPLTCKVTVDKAFSELNNGSTVTNKEAYSVINPYQGIAVYKNTEGSETITFTKAASQNAAAPSNNSSLQMTLAKNVATRGNTNAVTVDNAVVSFKEGNVLPKFSMLEGNANLYIPQGNEEYAIVSTNAQGEMPVNFVANEEGAYTITVNPENVEMNYLHLKDNITGTDVDLLTNPSYTFTANEDDYPSRFILVFSAINNENDNENEDFAFIGSDGQLIVSGNGTIQIIDIMGRVISTRSTEERISTNGMTPGVYVLRLIGNENKTQKIVIK